jgi:hypothetical protein
MKKSGSPWASDDLEILWSMVRSGKSFKDIAVLLERTEEEIITKTREMGFKKSQRKKNKRGPKPPS